LARLTPGEPITTAGDPDRARPAQWAAGQPGTTTAKISRCLKSLRLHGLIKQVARTFKYHLTDLGRRIVVGALALKEMTIVRAVAAPVVAA